MSRKFKFSKDLLGLGVDMYKKSNVTIEPGVTVLVGCNGSGKTTFMRYIHETLNKNKIPNVYFNNLFDGGENARAAAGFRNDFAFLATAAVSSEGENIVMNLGRTSYKVGSAFTEALKNKTELWILLDAVDSGLSIDNIVSLKTSLFDTVIKDAAAHGQDVYIVVSANSYEMARGERCLDVQNMKYKTFKTYDSYRKYVLKSSDLKTARDFPEKVEGKSND